MTTFGQHGYLSGLLIAAMLACLSLQPECAENLAPAAESNAFGFNDDWGISSEGHMSWQAYAQARKANMGYVRYWIYMYMYQDANGNIRWDYIDRLVRKAQFSGLNVYFTVVFPSSYMTPQQPKAYQPWLCYNPITYDYDASLHPDCVVGSYFDVPRFQSFVRQAVARYGDRVKYWGFGNEMTWRVFWRSGDVYEKIFVPAYDAAHAEAAARGFDIKVVGPDNNVYGVGGGFDEDLWVERNRYGRRLWDVLSFHYYERDFDTWMAIANQYRNFGGNREVWVTEAGYRSTDGDAASMATQAGDVGRLYDRMLYAMAHQGLNKFFLYRLQRDAAWEHGVLDRQANPLPAFEAIKARLCPAGSTESPAAINPLGDFNGDRYADYADAHRGANRAWVHQSLGNGSFSGGNYASFALNLNDFTCVAADVTGDRRAEVIQYHPDSGLAWVNALSVNGDASSLNTLCQLALPRYTHVSAGDMNGDGYGDIVTREPGSGQLHCYYRNPYAADPQAWFSLPSLVGTTSVGADWQILIGDFTGDGYLEYADHHKPSGRFFVHQNLRNGTISPFGANAWWGDTMPNVGDWTTLVADFTGDGFADYADFHKASGQFWVHRNMTDGRFAPAGTNWGYADTAPEDEWWRILGK
jgi:hypothetical protein